MKTCSKCKTTYDNVDDNFYKSIQMKDGYSTWCKSCSKEYAKTVDPNYRIEYYKNNTDRFRNYYAEHREELKSYARQWRLNNLEHAKWLCKEYRINNREKYNEISRKHHKIYYKKRRDESDLYRKIAVIRHNIWAIFKRNTCSEKFCNLLGLDSGDQFKDHIYSLLLKGMKKEDYGTTWKISNDKLGSVKSIDEIKEACYYKNFYPSEYKTYSK